MTMTEVREPATKLLAQSSTNVGQALPVASLGLGPNAILQFLQAFLPWLSYPAMEVVSQEIKALVAGVYDPSLRRMQRKFPLSDPMPHQIQGPFRFFASLAQNHEIIRVSHHRIAGFRQLVI